MLVPGPWRGLGEFIEALTARGIDATSNDSLPLKKGEVRVLVVEEDDLASAFSWGRGGALDKKLVSRIGKCNRAALVEIGCRLADSAIEVARIGRALRDVGGLAVRMEASGGASEWETWLKCLETGAPSSIYKSTVILVRDEGRGPLFTCGMHLFDLPDAEIEIADDDEAIEWLDAFCIYQIEENPTLVSGHTFRPAEEAERRVLERWPDGYHVPEDGRYNPFGIWKLKTRDAARIEAAKLTLTFIPTLTSLLIAAERSKGTPLTPRDVEEIVAAGAVIAMEPRDASALERSRGYADIEPELAWEQWQIVRGAGLWSF